MIRDPYAPTEVKARRLEVIAERVVEEVTRLLKIGTRPPNERQGYAPPGDPDDE